MSSDAFCGSCGRAMSAGRPTCLVCGWEPGHAEHTYGAQVARVRYVQGATLSRFVWASLALGPLAHTLLRSGWEKGDPGLFLTGSLCVALGPLVACVQGLRRARGAVETTPDGLWFGGEEIPWTEFDGVELVGERGIGPGLGAVSGASRSRALRLITGGRGTLGLLLLPLTLLFTLVFPAVRLLSPWHPKVVLERARGDRLELHDLDDEAGFHAAVRARLAVSHLTEAA